jgi:hypothetical protein
MKYYLVEVYIHGKIYPGYELDKKTRLIDTFQMFH